MLISKLVMCINSRGFTVYGTFLISTFSAKVEKILKGSQDVIPSPLPFGENSNYWQESVLED